MHTSPSLTVQGQLCSSDLPLQILDADLVPGLLIIIKPLTLREIYIREFCP